MKLSEKIKQIRKEKGISQRELGRQIGMSGQMISKIEGDSTTPSLETLVKISTALGVKVTDLIPPKKESPSLSIIPKGMAENIVKMMDEEDRRFDKYHDLRNQALIVDIMNQTNQIMDSFHTNPDGWNKHTPLAPDIMAKQFKDIMVSIGLTGVYVINDTAIQEMLYSQEFKSFIELLMLKYDTNSKDSDN